MFFFIEKSPLFEKIQIQIVYYTEKNISILLYSPNIFNFNKNKFRW